MLYQKNNLVLGKSIDSRCYKHKYTVSTFIVSTFIDFTKIFDMVSHKKLLLSLQEIGIRGLVLKLFRVCLQDRKQQVKIRNLLSEEVDVDYDILYKVPF